jgi:hypothetical protein
MPYSKYGYQQAVVKTKAATEKHIDKIIARGHTWRVFRTEKGEYEVRGYHPSS